MKQRIRNSEEQALCSTLEFLLELEQKKIALWKQELGSFPEGTLHLVNRQNKFFFQHEINRHRRGITRDLDLVYKLARKKYLQLLLKEKKDAFQYAYNLSGSEISTDLLKKKLSRTEKLLEHYAKAGLKILRITCSEKQYRWAMADYRRNMMNPEELKYETYSGIKVRSKSEQSIANSLELLGIPYRYEMELNLKVIWMNGVLGMSPGGYKKYYPDFVIPSATGEIFIWEHLGRVDEEKYRAHNMEKIAAYRQNGVCDFNHLILTFEKDMEKTGTVEQLIAMRILPYQ